MNEKLLVSINGGPMRREMAVDDLPDVQPPILLTVDEAASWCRITRHTLNHLRLRGRFAPAIKIGRRCFWTPDDLNAWIAAQREVVA